MAIEIIPAGASAVVSDKHNDNKSVELMGAIKDAEADAVRTVKDAEADLERSAGQHFGNTLMAIKDAEADLERSAGQHYADTVKTVKDTEANLDRATGDRFMQIVQDIKDAESRLDRSSGDRFIQTVQDIKEVEIATEKSKGHVVETVRQAEFQGAKDGAHTRESMAKYFYESDMEREKSFCDVKEVVKDKFSWLSEKVGYGFKDAQATAFKLAAEADKTACNNQLQILLQFKDQAMLSEKLAAQASRELEQTTCALKGLIREDGQKTRDLINAQEVDRLRERACKAEQQLALLQLNVKA